VGVAMCGLFLLGMLVIWFWPVGRSSARNARVHLVSGFNKIDEPFLAMGAVGRFGGGTRNAGGPDDRDA
jgi:hypothetical protein